MSTTNVNIRMDSELKKQFSEFCKDVGMNMSTAFNIFANKTVKEWRIPFTIGQDEPNAETLEAFREVEEMKKHPDQYKAYDSVDALFEDLDA